MSTLKLLIRSLVRVYYQDNIGFFLVVLYLAFGVLRANEHIALATSIANSLTLTLLTIGLWSVYYLKSLGFIYKILNTKQYKFIRELLLYPKSKQFAWLFLVQLLIGLPAWGYAAFISLFNFQFGTYTNWLIMFGFLILANATITATTIYFLKKPTKEIQPGLWTRLISKNISLPYPIWYVRHLFVHEPMLAFLSKTGSLLLLLGSFYLYETDVYDWRLLAVGALFAFIINSILIYNYYEFNRKNYWTYNLPIPKPQIIISTLATLFILFIPEILLILINVPASINITDSVGLILFGVSIGYFLLNSLLLKPMLKENYGKRVFSLLVLMIFIIMYSIPLIIVDFILLALGAWILSRYYQFILR